MKGFAALYLISGLVLALLVGGFYLSKTSNKNMPFFPQFNQSISKFSAAPTPDQTNATNWQTYSIKELGLEFKLPQQLVDKSIFKQELITAPDGLSAQTGNTICARFSKKKVSLINVAYAGGLGCFRMADDLLSISSTSKDFTAPRSGTFGDLQGFKIEGNKYYFKDNLGRFDDVSSYKLQVVNNPNGVSILKVMGDSPSVPGYEMGYPIAGSLGKGDIGALINTNRADYPGIALQAKLSDIDEQTFDKILATFKFN